MSALWMLTPAEGFKGMKRKLLQHIQSSAGKPCPPIIIGLGVGGGADIALKLAKKSLLRPLGEPNPDPEVQAAAYREADKFLSSLGFIAADRQSAKMQDP